MVYMFHRWLDRQKCKVKRSQLVGMDTRLAFVSRWCQNIYGPGFHDIYIAVEAARDIIKKQLEELELGKLQ